MLQTVHDWLWWDRLWLPENVSWSDLEDGDGRVYAKATHLYAALPCALCLLLVRLAFERWERTCGNMISPPAGGRYYSTFWFSHHRDYFCANYVEQYVKSPEAEGCGGLEWGPWWGLGGGVPSLLTCFHLHVTRYCCCRFVATPLADVWGIRDRIRVRPEANPLLENYFCQKARAPSQVG